MLLTSTYGPNATWDIPLIIICYAGRKFFMLKTNAYSQMVSELRQIFDIQITGQLRIETAALDVCRGSSIEVGEDVWPVLLSILDEICVMVTAEELDDEGSPKRALAQSRVEMDKHGCRVLVDDEERNKDEYVEKWLEQQDGEDDVPPPPSVYSRIE